MLTIILSAAMAFCIINFFGSMFKKIAKKDDDKRVSAIEKKIATVLSIQKEMYGSAMLLCDWLDQMKEEGKKIAEDDYEFFQTVKVKMFQAAAMPQEDWLIESDNVMKAVEEMSSRTRKYQ